MKTFQSSEDRNFLFMYSKPNRNIRKEAFATLRRSGIRVYAQYSDIAVEIGCNSYQAEEIFELGYFQFYLVGRCNPADYKFLSPEQLEVLNIWNARFTEKKKKDMPPAAWNDKRYGEPLPDTAIDPQEFIEKLKEHKIEVKKSEGKTRTKELTGNAFVKFEEKLRKKYGNATVAYHLARLALRLDPGYWPVIEDLSTHLLEWIIFIVGEDYQGKPGECWKMTGSVAVGVVIVESELTDGPKFTDDERNRIRDKIREAHGWLAKEHPEHELFWYYDYENVQISENDRIRTEDERYWIFPGMEKVNYRGHTYSGDFEGIKKYREDLKNLEKADYAIVIFVSPYVSTRIYAHIPHKFIILAQNTGNIPITHDFMGFGIDNLHLVTAHETCHLFGAADEYTGEGTPCSTCGTLHGCHRIPNGNCNSCAKPMNPCIMGITQLNICDYTRGQIGWADLFVEVWTSNTEDARATAAPILNIGSKEYILSPQAYAAHGEVTPYIEGYSNSHFDAGFRDGFAIWDKDLDLGDIERIMFRLAVYGSWRIDKYKVIFRGNKICEQTIDNLLSVDNPNYIGCTFRNNSVNSLIVEVTTGDVFNAGTDDIVRFYAGNQGWNLIGFPRNNFERGRRDRFDLGPQTGLDMSDFFRVVITKSPDGPLGGWFLKGLKVTANDIVVYDNQSINVWLEGNNDGRYWEDFL
ncbi:MAG: hypothetical protein IAE90_02405 [Ignavibacteria bacterium]|nr:hypothetical protein [Ignavibacteria bacterium]